MHISNFIRTFALEFELNCGSPHQYLFCGLQEQFTLLYNKTLMPTSDAESKNATRNLYFLIAFIRQTMF